MITFATLLFGNDQINYLFVLLQSIIDVYQGDTCIIVYYAGVDREYIDEIRCKAPFVLLRECKDLDFSGMDWKVKASFKTVGWCKIIEEQRWPEHLALIDVDTLVVKKINKCFEHNADILYTYKTNGDENLKWPINSGVVLVNNNPSISPRFFREWRDNTGKILSSADNIRAKHRHFWGGEDQAAMGFFLQTRDRELYSKLIVYDGILLKGIPCEELNETRCVPITGKTHIIHYKGKWRPILATGEFDDNSKWRPQEKCQVMFDLWNDTLKRWEER